MDRSSPRDTSDLALIGAGGTAALVAGDGDIPWLCWPRFDSPALLADLLGDAGHGVWRLRPDDAPGGMATASRAWEGDTGVLHTAWTTPTGKADVTDLLHAESPEGGPVLMRRVTGLSGTVGMSTTLALRGGYGRTRPHLAERSKGRQWKAALPGQSVVLTASRTGPGAAPRMRQVGANLEASFTIAVGEEVVFLLTCVPERGKGLRVPDPERVLADALQDGRKWGAESSCAAAHRDVVQRCLVQIRALVDPRTGGIVAAPTTSLPEEIGGERNWDYRYVWLRDGALMASTLLRAGHAEEAAAFAAWTAAAIRQEGVRIMYDLDGGTDLAERTVPWLPGYADSRPVRIGNGAAGQLQLDVYGEVLQLWALLAEYGVLPDQQAFTALMGHLEAHWAEPDAGLWEVRGPLRHFTHSRMMLWQALMVACRLVDAGHVTGPADRWRALAQSEHAKICAKGFDAARNTFTQSYGSRELDASLLRIASMGFLPPQDPRVRGTIDAVRRELSTGTGFLVRYRTAGSAPSVDGLEGEEGAFLLCSLWLADALHHTGRHEEARAELERVMAVRGAMGLLPEEVDSRGRHLGNSPQGFTLAAVVDSARLLASPRPVSIFGTHLRTDRALLPAHRQLAAPATPHAAGAS